MNVDLEQPAKRLQQVARRCLERVHELEQRLFRYHLPVVEERKHLQQGTTERSYFTAGYLQALKDVRDLIGVGEFPTKLNIDGGPRVAPNLQNGSEHGQANVSEL